MIVQSVAQCEELKREWTDQYVQVKDRPELRRFLGIIGRVVTVNYNGMAIIDLDTIGIRFLVGLCKWK